ncbi:MAG: flagellar basal body rod protein FlgB [Deltaproteobacteria bacterium]|nr:flagellar basal body rod protein FlgB [Deltaproteobacteria bacterium]
MPPLFNKTFDVLSNMLTYRSKRHQVILSNVTNIDTPGFKAADLTFRKDLREAMVSKGKVQMIKTQDRHMAPELNKNDPGNYETSETEEAVKLDSEMVNLAENNLMYNTTVEMLARKFRTLQTALRETK